MKITTREAGTLKLSDLIGDVVRVVITTPKGEFTIRQTADGISVRESSGDANLVVRPSSADAIEVKAERW